MGITYKGKRYRDDRLFVSNLMPAKITRRFGGFNLRKFEEKDIWVLRTFENTEELPMVDQTMFDTIEEAFSYVHKTEYKTPLISNDGEPLVIPPQDHMVLDDPDVLEEATDDVAADIRRYRNTHDFKKWNYYCYWMFTQEPTLFSVIHGEQYYGNPDELRQNCPYYEDERGYTYNKINLHFAETIDGIEEDVLRSNGNYQDITWKRGMKNGLGIEYFGKPKGPVYIKCYHKDDQLHGPYERFYENGQLRSKGQLTDGVQTGYWEWFDEDGKLTKKGTFENGELNEE